MDIELRDIENNLLQAKTVDPDREVLIFKVNREATEQELGNIGRSIDEAFEYGRLLIVPDWMDVIIVPKYTEED